jgi:dUTPase
MEFNNITEFNSFVNQVKNNSCHDKIMLLSIFVDSDDEELKKLYVEAAQKHNQKILDDPHFYDAGFDVFLPKYEQNGTECSRFFSPFDSDSVWSMQTPVTKVDFNIKCSAKLYNNYNLRYTSFYTYARSSMSKTPLRLANNQGIIDTGYRGNLIGMFDNISKNIWYMNKYSRMLQICAPGLIPIYVNIVNTIDELGPSTSRGDGGFGSTGI